jgi:hypothetical protein
LDQPISKTTFGTRGLDLQRCSQLASADGQVLRGLSKQSDPLVSHRPAICRRPMGCCILKLSRRHQVVSVAGRARFLGRTEAAPDRVKRTTPPDSRGPEDKSLAFDPAECNLVCYITGGGKSKDSAFHSLSCVPFSTRLNERHIGINCSKDCKSACRFAISYKLQSRKVVYSTDR